MEPFLAVEDVSTSQAVLEVLDWVLCFLKRRQRRRRFVLDHAHVCALTVVQLLKVEVDAVVATAGLRFTADVDDRVIPLFCTATS